ncbi:MAG: epoxyqueuosine reductase, partial [archaeon]|nr:epoxyqueuosine reductase [archaeon]
MELLKLKEAVKKIALDSGADLVGIGSKERLDGNPPSTDMEYSLPGAKSCIIWAYANPIDGLEKYFSKTERMSMKVAQDKGYVTGWQTAEKMVEFIENNTEFKADPVVPNMKYRSGTQNILGGEAFPPFSLRYGAVSAGLGHIGWSGNLVTSEYGASLYLNGVITTAPLEADPMAEKNNCNKCKICQNVCTTGYVSKGEAEDRQPVIIGGIKQIYGKRGIFMKCGISCAGFTGLSEDGTWSTWSANSENGLCLKKIPENEWDEDF